MQKKLPVVPKLIHKEKTKEINVNVSLFQIKTRLNFTSNFLDQNNPKSKYKCKNELIYIRHFEAVQKRQSCFKTLPLVY